MTEAELPLLTRLALSDGYETFIASDGQPAVRANVGLLREAADEIQRLSSWKAEALAVLDEWENVYQRCTDRPDMLGLTKAACVLARIEELEAGLEHIAAKGYTGASWVAHQILTGDLNKILQMDQERYVKDD